MYFKDKTIFLISPQHWRSNKISKHHYADILASTGAIVFFINPIKHGYRFITEIENVKKNLNVVTINVPFPRAVKFKLKFLFDYTIRYCFKKFLNKTGPPDILWNFDNGTYFSYEDLFGNSFRIFHPVDMMVIPSNVDYDSKYHIVFSVSSEILEKICHKRKHFINHGLHNDIIEYFNNHSTISHRKMCSNVTYMGNISIPFLNRDAILKIINKLPLIEFRMIGEFDPDCSFQKKLKAYPNVIFYGRLSGKSLYKLLMNADFLLICYKKHTLYNADNTHKMLEYLSTGNPIISSPMSVYQDHSDLISFIDFDRANYLELFEHLLENFSSLNTAEIRQQRIDLALNNTYLKQIERIDRIIQKYI